jgi:hypothetical protein
MKAPAFAVAVITLSAATSSTALATSHAHNGAFCKSRDPNIAHAALSGVFNQGSQPATVLCQVHRDAGGTENLRQVRVVVYDRHVSQDVACAVRVLGVDGAQRWVSHKATSGFASSAMVLLWTDVVSMGVNDTITLECNLPANTANGFSHVASYLTEE